jgi:hypothetical protein
MRKWARAIRESPLWFFDQQIHNEKAGGGFRLTVVQGGIILLGSI